MEDIFDEIAADLAEEMRSLGQDMVADAKRRLSVDVSISRGPRGGKVLIHSKRGESPRRETSGLQADIQSEVTSDGTTLSLSVSSSKIYAPILQNKLGRPVLSDTDAAFSDAFADRASAVISGK